MIYTKEIWRLPVLTHEKVATLHYGTYRAGITAENSGVPASIPYRVLLDLANEIELVRESQQPEDMER
eukprot:2198142-Rhodomonas_salina.1